MRTFSDRLGKGWTGKKHVNDFDTWYVRGYSWAAESASLKDLAALREYLLTSRGGKLTDQLYNPSPELAFYDKSILTFLLRKSNRWGNPLDLSPLDAIGFIEGALEWRLQRNRLLRSRLRKKKRLLALPAQWQTSSQLAVNRWMRARAVQFTDTGAAINAAPGDDNGSQGLTDPRREQYLHPLCEIDEDQWKAFFSELDAEPLEETATETPKFDGRGSQPPALQ